MVYTQQNIRTWRSTLLLSASSVSGFVKNLIETPKSNRLLVFVELFVYVVYIRSRESAPPHKRGSNNTSGEDDLYRALLHSSLCAVSSCTPSAVTRSEAASNDPARCGGGEKERERKRAVLALASFRPAQFSLPQATNRPGELRCCCALRPTHTHTKTLTLVLPLFPPVIAHCVLCSQVFTWPGLKHFRGVLLGR